MTLALRAAQGGHDWTACPSPSDSDIRLANGFAACTEIQALLARIARRLRRLLEPLRTASNAAPDALDLEIRRIGARAPESASRPDLTEKRTAFIDGFSLHAGVHLHANDREGLKHLCCYGARGPLSLQRLPLTADGQVCDARKRPMHGGKTVLVLTPAEFL